MKQITLLLFIGMVGIFAMLLAPILSAAPAEARINQGGCTTPGGGNLPPGQQPNCQGGGLTQQPNTNPHGQAPPGQNK